MAIANESPAAVARLFQIVVKAVCKHVVLSSQTSSVNRDKSNALGPLIATPYVLQSNERGSLHLHMLAFGSPLSANLLTKVAHDESLHARIAQVVNELVVASIPFDVAIRKRLLRLAHVPTYATCDVAIRPACDVTEENLDEFFYDLAESRNTHRHTFTYARENHVQIGYPRCHNTTTGIFALRRVDPFWSDTTSSCACKCDFSVAATRAFNTYVSSFTSDSNGIQHRADERSLCFMHECITRSFSETAETIARAL